MEPASPLSKMLTPESRPRAVKSTVPKKFTFLTPSSIKTASSSRGRAANVALTSPEHQSVLSQPSLPLSAPVFVSAPATVGQLTSVSHSIQPVHLYDSDYSEDLIHDTATVHDTTSDDSTNTDRSGTPPRCAPLPLPPLFTTIFDRLEPVQSATPLKRDASSQGATSSESNNSAQTFTSFKSNSSSQVKIYPQKTPLSNNHIPTLKNSLPGHNTKEKEALPDYSDTETSDSTSSTSMPFNLKSLSLYVGDLHIDVMELDLFNIFGGPDIVHSIRVCRDKITRRSLGYAYVNFRTEQDAETAIIEKNGFSSALTHDRPLRIMWAERDPAKRKLGDGNLRISNLAKSVDTKTLFHEFSKFGPILSCKVCLDTAGASAGFGYVHFREKPSAAAAAAALDGACFYGQTLSVQTWMSRREREAAGLTSARAYTNVYVKNLHASLCTPYQLREAFGAHGVITSAHAPLDAAGAPLGFAFLNFARAADAAACVAAQNGRILLGQTLFAGPAKRRSELAAELARGDAERARATKLYVRNVCDDVSARELCALFARHGAVRAVSLRENERGSRTGFGFVDMDDPADAAVAVARLNGTMLRTKPVYVAVAQPRDVRQAQFAARHGVAARAAGPAHAPPGTPLPPAAPAADEAAERRAAAREAAMEAARAKGFASGRPRGSGSTFFPLQPAGSASADAHAADNNVTVVGPAARGGTVGEGSVSRGSPANRGETTFVNTHIAPPQRAQHARQSSMAPPGRKYMNPHIMGSETTAPAGRGARGSEEATALREVPSRDAAASCGSVATERRESAGLVPPAARTAPRKYFNPHIMGEAPTAPAPAHPAPRSAGTPVGRASTTPYLNPHIMGEVPAAPATPQPPRPAPRSTGPTAALSTTTRYMNPHIMAEAPTPPVTPRARGPVTTAARGSTTRHMSPHIMSAAPAAPAPPRVTLSSGGAPAGHGSTTRYLNPHAMGNATTPPAPAPAAQQGASATAGRGGTPRYPSPRVTGEAPAATAAAQAAPRSACAPAGHESTTKTARPHGVGAEAPATADRSAPPPAGRSAPPARTGAAPFSHPAMGSAEALGRAELLARARARQVPLLYEAPARAPRVVREQAVVFTGQARNTERVLAVPGDDDMDGY